MTVTDRGYYVFHFFLATDFMSLKKGTIKISWEPLRLQRWEPDFNPDKPRPAHQRQWVRFPALPLEMWNVNIIFSIGKALGKPMFLDSNTKNKVVGQYARLCIEMEVSSNRPDELMAERTQGGVQGFFKQAIEYELVKCNGCGKYGHLTEYYPLLKRRPIPKEEKNDMEGGESLVQ
ncbi:hypothetical protein NE237_009490 [Protea cynaroides]|uniref:DUF4283 domain-containing protein n=1 Tax=Protea cynaroides TaxID=273540 RepID=A0A9Q0KXX5_9MAGN|nr:hypothetical protein NE237_009490 [Protea cynaroides]